MRIVVLATGLFIGLSASAIAETSSQIAASRPVETFAFFKKALKKAGAAEDADVRKREKFVTLTSCSTSYDFIGDDLEEKSVVANIADLAFDTIYLEAILKIAGYPRKIWVVDLAEYERKNLSAIDKFNISTSGESSAKTHLAKKLNDYKKSTGGHFKDVKAGMEDCGAGEINVFIPTDPAAQRVQYINAVKYDLCTFQRIDPKGADCNHWFDYGDEGALMAGTYKIRVTWSDGQIAYRDLDADSLSQKNGRFSFPIRKR